MVVLWKHNRMKATVCVYQLLFSTSLSPVLPSFFIVVQFDDSQLFSAPLLENVKKSLIGHTPTSLELTHTPSISNSKLYSTLCVLHNHKSNLIITGF